MDYPPKLTAEINDWGFFRYHVVTRLFTLQMRLDSCIADGKNMNSNYASYIAWMQNYPLISRPRVYRLKYFDRQLFLRPTAEA